jgi:long-chain acyl-CoA synthetase
MTHPLSQRIADVLDLQGEAPALEFEGQWLSWGQIGTLARTIRSLAATTTGSQHPPAGIVLRNRPAQVAALLGVLLSDGCVVVINPSRGDERTRADISALQLPVVIGEPDDVAALVPTPAGAAVVSISDLESDPQVTPATGRAGCSAGFVARPGVAVWMLTSGTTGPPNVSISPTTCSRTV